MRSHFQALLNAALRLPVELRERLRWRRGAASGGAKIFYGFDRLPAPHELGHGGIIKVQDLQRRFPNTPRAANLLYLISSYQPLFAPRLVTLARRAGARFVLNQNGVAYPGWYGPDWERSNATMRELLRQADHVVYQSRFCQQTADRYLGPAACPSEILLNPVDTTVFTPAKCDPAPGRFVILLAGSHGTFSRAQVAVDALAELLPRLPEARLVIAGRCAWRDDFAAAQSELRAYAEKRGVGAALELRGPYPQTAAVALLQSAHVLLHTKYNDPCPRLVVEALACGLPIVYSATGGVPELVGEGAGSGVSGPLDYEQEHPPCPAALAAALRQVAGRRAEFAAAARARAVTALDVQPWLQRHAEIFQGLLTP
jgi:glycosyltransferase involved in cell wall biosynthesis